MWGRPLNRLVGVAFVCWALGQAQEVRASHLVGGDLGYQYLGETFPGSGLFRYNLKMRMYLNCGPSSNWPQMIDWLQGAPGLNVGVYVEDPLNPGAAKVRYTVAVVTMTSYSVITPDIPDSCVLGDGQCVEESLFEGEVVVPASTGGYHLYFQGYSRNDAILNLFDPGNAGFGIYSFIPPTAIVNSSPVFSGVPVPFICVTESTSFSSAAEDADGDSLVFTFEKPYDSQEDIAGIVQPPLVLDWPIAPVVYASPDYNELQPFGPGGVATINQETGAAQFSAPMIGNWAVAVEVKEYRNGQFIGRIKSDMQLLSLPCSDNDAPAPVGGELTTAYQVNAGDTLCFPLAFVDANGDTIHLDANGTIFDSTLFNPPAVISGAAFGDSTITGTFCWPTVCDQGRPEPYTFTVVAYDEACPPALYSATITVDVVTAAEQLAISGPPVACAGQTTATYCAESGGGTEFLWSVTGGTLTSSTNGPCVTVEWNTSGIGTVEVTSDVGDCVFSSEQTISIVDPPQASFLVEMDTTCTGIKARAVNSSTDGTTAQWLFNGQPLTPGDTTELILPFSLNSTVQLTVTDVNGCTDQDAQSFSVAPYSEVVEFRIPNVFSPNGDGKNDRFELITSQHLSECSEIRIFDRWGKEVFASGGGRMAWNGSRGGGEKASEGVYYYIVKVDQESFHGHVSLMR